MNKLDVLKEHFGKTLNVLECDNVNGSDVVSFGTDEEPYVLNFQLDDDCTIRVSVINKEKKNIVDTYTDTYENEDEFSDRMDDAEAAYNVILASKPAVEAKLESKAEATRRGDIIDCMKMIQDDANRFTTKYDHDYNEADKDFYIDFAFAATAIEGVLNEAREHAGDYKPLKENEEPSNEPADQGEKAVDKKDNKSVVEIDETAETLENANELTLLQVLIDKLNKRALNCEDEIDERVISDVAVQLDELLDELETIVQEG